MQQNDFFRKINRENILNAIYKICWVTMIGSSIGIGVFIFLHFSQVLLTENFLEIITGADVVVVKSPDSMKITDSELESLSSLIRNGHVLTQNGLLLQLARFYNSIIGLLVVIISILGVMAYLSIYSVSKSAAEDMVDRQVAKEVDRQVTKGITSKFADITFIETTFTKSAILNDFMQVNKNLKEDAVTMKEELSNIEVQLTTIEPRFKEIYSKAASAEYGFTLLEKRLEGIESELESLGIDFGRIKSQTKEIEAKTNDVASEFENVEAHMEQVGDHFEDLGSRIENVEEHFNKNKDENNPESETDENNPESETDEKNPESES